MIIAETKSYKSSLINNRRYLGNKYKLLPFITGVVNAECEVNDAASVPTIYEYIFGIA